MPLPTHSPHAGRDGPAQLNKTHRSSNRLRTIAAAAARTPGLAAPKAPPRDADRGAAEDNTTNETHVDQRNSARRVACGHRGWPDTLRPRHRDSFPRTEK